VKKKPDLLDFIGEYYGPIIGIRYTGVPIDQPVFHWMGKIGIFHKPKS
jgi:hypothetical protein